MAMLVGCSGRSNAFDDLFAPIPRSDAGAPLDGSAEDRAIPDRAAAAETETQPDARQADDGSPGDAATSRDAYYPGALDGAEDTTFRDAKSDGTSDASAPGALLHGQRWEVSCAETLPDPRLCSNLAPGVVECPNDYRPVEKKVAFGGLPGKLYSVALRLRGVVEVKTYPGGTPAAGHVQLGGTPRPGPVNVYGFSVSAPDQTYYINADPSDQGPFVIPLDETVTVPIEGGAIIELFATDMDCVQLRNCISPGPASCPPYVIPGVAPAPRPFVGQFAQVDVVSVVP